MQEGSLFEILLHTKKRLSRWMQIEKWKALMRDYRQEKKYRKKYNASKLGPFWPFINTNLYHTSLITGKCKENQWLRLPWDIWKLILQYVPYANEFMMPVSTFFNNNILKHGKPKYKGKMMIDCMHWRLEHFQDYIPHISRKIKLRNGPHFKTKKSGTYKLYSVDQWMRVTYPIYKKIKIRKLNNVELCKYSRVNKPIVNGNYFQQFEWKPKRVGEMLFQLDPETTNAITASVSIGEGFIVNFSMNGKLVKDKIRWKEFCILDAAYGGLICDNELIVKFSAKDTWFAESMTNYGIVFNSVDSTKMENVEEVKRKSSKRNKNVVNI